MQRTGVRAENAYDFFEHVNQFELFRYCGIYSHLATGGNPDHPFTREQIKTFSEITKPFQKPYLSSGQFWRIDSLQKRTF